MNETQEKIIFSVLQIEYGKRLEAVGYDSGKRIAEIVARHSGHPNRLALIAARGDCDALLVRPLVPRHERDDPPQQDRMPAVPHDDLELHPPPARPERTPGQQGSPASGPLIHQPHYPAPR